MFEELSKNIYIYIYKQHFSRIALEIVENNIINFVFKLKILQNGIICYFIKKQERIFKEAIDIYFILNYAIIQIIFQELILFKTRQHIHVIIRLIELVLKLGQ